jgi:hypothetical protein
VLLLDPPRWYAETTAGEPADVSPTQIDMSLTRMDRSLDRAVPAERKGFPLQISS